MDARLPAPARTRPILALAALLAASALPAHATNANRYVLAASAALHPAAIVQESDRFRLEAAFTAASSSASGGRYSLAAHVTPLALVCTPDTIFMDGFDGD